jgi:hypothetical protein
MLASEEMFAHVKSKIWSSGHSNSYVWLVQTTSYSLVYPLNGPITLPTSLEWKLNTVKFGGLILMVCSEEWLSTAYKKSGVGVIITPMYGWLKRLVNR